MFEVEVGLSPINRFFKIFEEEFRDAGFVLYENGPKAGEPGLLGGYVDNLFLFRLSGYMLYTLYDIVLTLLISFSCLFHLISLTFLLWRKWGGVGVGLWELWTGERVQNGVW
ncbi:uncharacterized protein V1510DRAFT_393898 [Dipodascopsis tothii]|uniref:uncharacterized protein n=1 Tax=Dipodascopsis tothii TaxID=44089 RepID=UPI0034CFA9F9